MDELFEMTNTRIQPYAHQVVGIRKLVEQPVVGLWDEPGAGKSKQVIDAAQVLFHRGEITTVLVVTPAAVRSVWFDPLFGELRKHLWNVTAATVHEFHTRTGRWTTQGPEGRQMHWVVTNYEYIRPKDRIERLTLLADRSRGCLLVLDESSAVKSHRAKQSKAAHAIRQSCSRVVLLNGTPIANNPLDLYSQGQIMSRRILECRTMTHFKARYAIMGGFQHRQVLEWQNLDDLQRRFAPYVLRRLKSDCLDLPEKLPPVTMTVPLTPTSWRIYKEMRDEMISWLSDTNVAVAAQAGVRAMRLAQITSGFLGGIEVEDTAPFVDDGRPDFIPFERTSTMVAPPQVIGSEKLDHIISWLEARLEESPSYKVMLWFRFRLEVSRLLEALRERLPHVQAGAIWGKQNKEERAAAVRLLDPRSAPEGPAVILSTSAGAKGLNLTAGEASFYGSLSTSLETWLQSIDRIHRPGQEKRVGYFYLVATGPSGQKTIDHTVLKALFNKDDLARWTTSAWLSALREE